MTSLTSIGLTVLGGVLATTGGLVIAWRQHVHERDVEQQRLEREALLELADALRPLLIELDRWVGPRKGDWVGSSRSLPELGTWIKDDESNAQQPLDLDAIVNLAYGVERLWWGRLQTRIDDRGVHDTYGQLKVVAFHLSRRDTADKRVAGMQLLERVEEVLAAINTAVARGPHWRRERR